MGRESTRRTLVVLHPVFALTGVMHAIGGPLLPSLVATFHLDDRQSGLLFLLYFGGTSLGALLCRANYARAMAIGFGAAAIACLFVTSAGWPLLLVAFLLLGISVGMPMASVSLFTGRAFPQSNASVLTALNFTWSAGALLAPLLAARVLVSHTYRFAYAGLALAAVCAALLCAAFLRDSPEAVPTSSTRTQLASLRLIIIFALAAFLEVGIENTSVAWLPTYALRTAHQGVVFAVASTSIYWVGFLASRGLSALLLLRVRAVVLFRICVGIALIAGSVLTLTPSLALRNTAIFLLGAGLAPIFPLLLSQFFSLASHTSQSRWILASAGFGGSVLPWLAGVISAATGTIRTGILVIPAALLVMLLIVSVGAHHTDPRISEG